MIGFTALCSMALPRKGGPEHGQHPHCNATAKAPMALRQHKAGKCLPAYGLPSDSAALRHRAAAVVLSHNHPGGNVEPGRADEALAQTIGCALAGTDLYRGLP